MWSRQSDFALSCIPQKTCRHTHTDKHLAKGALPQDFAQLELPRVSLLRALLDVVGDADLLDGHVILHSRTRTKGERISLALAPDDSLLSCG